MAWAGVRFHGKTIIRIIDKGVKVNSDFYIIKFRSLLFSGGQIKDMIFHQDSTSSHTSKHTLAYLRQEEIIFPTPEKMDARKSDAAPIDFAIWNILKRRLQTAKAM